MDQSTTSPCQISELVTFTEHLGGKSNPTASVKGARTRGGRIQCCPRLLRHGSRKCSMNWNRRPVDSEKDDIMVVTTSDDISKHKESIILRRFTLQQMSVGHSSLCAESPAQRYFIGCVRGLVNLRLIRIIFTHNVLQADSVADQSTRVKLKTTGLRVPKTNGGYMLLPYPHSSSQFYAEKKERSQCYFTAPFRAIVQSIALYFA
uniref:Uncharacterized protein n=1 Tax=Hyaloperonospora arabidopsidis (strain Emoy2) TaxID=559515 RepID=M4BHB7_HYAAE